MLTYFSLTSTYIREISALEDMKCVLALGTQVMMHQPRGVSSSICET